MHVTTRSAVLGVRQHANLQQPQPRRIQTFYALVRSEATQ